MTSITNRHSPDPTHKTESIPQNHSNFQSSNSTFKSNTSIFFSRVRRGDRYLSAAIQEGYLDNTGTFIDQKIDDNKPIPSLENPENKNIKISLETTVQITKPTKKIPEKSPTIDLSISSPFSKILSNVQHSIEGQYFSDVEEIKLVGGVVPHCLRGQYLERWLIGLYGQKIGAVPTTELLNKEVCRQMEGSLSDIDSRVVLKNVKNTLKNLRDELLKSLAKESVGKSSSKDLAEFLRSLHEEYAHIKPITKDLVAKVLKGAFLLKSYSTSNPKSIDQLAIISFGDRTEMVFEILLQIRLERPCLFRRDSLRLNIKKFLETGNPIFLNLESDFQKNQVMSDWNGQVIHIPDFKVVDEDDWPALISRMVAKGDRCLVPGTEKKLFDIFVEKAKENQKELSIFILECFSKRLTNHHLNDEMANTAIAYQICSSMKHCGAPSNIIDAVWRGLSKSIYDKNCTLLHQISQAQKNAQISFEDLEACIELGSFTYLNTTEEKEENPALLTQHEGTSTVLEIKSSSKTYHLWHRFKPEQALDHILKLKDFQPELLTILNTFSKLSLCNPVKVSPYKEYLSASFSLESFAEKIKTLINNEAPLLSYVGVQLYLGCQAIQPIPPLLLIENLPRLLTNAKLKESQHILLEQLSSLYPELFAQFISSLKKAIDFDNLNEQQFREQWILCASTSQERLLKNSALDLAITDKAFMQYLKKLLPEKASFAIAMVRKALEKKTQSLEVLFKAVGGICNFYPKCKTPFDPDQDIDSLYNLAIEIVYNPLFQISIDVGQMNLLLNAFSWLVQDLFNRGKIDKSSNLLIGLCEKDIISPSSSLAANQMIKMVAFYAGTKEIQKIENILFQSEQLKIKWKTFADQIPPEIWIFLTQDLYNLNTDRAESVADECCTLFLRSKEKSAATILTRYFSRKLEVEYASLENIISDSNINERDKLQFKISLLELHIKKQNILKVKNILFSLSKDELTDGDVKKIHALISEFFSLLHRINSQDRDKAICESETVIMNEAFQSIFRHHPENLIELIQLAYSQISNETLSRHSNIALGYCILILDVINDVQLGKPLCERLCDCLCHCLPMAVRSSYSNSTKLLRKWNEIQTQVFQLLKTHDLITPSCRLLSVLLTENFPITEIPIEYLIRIFQNIITENSLNHQNIRNAIFTFEHILNNIQISDKNISQIIDLGQRILSYKIDLGETLCQKFIQSNIQNKTVFYPFLNLVYNEIFKRSLSTNCLRFLLKLKTSGLTPFDTQSAAETLAFKIFEQNLKPPKKTDFPSIVTLFEEFSITNKKLIDLTLKKVDEIDDTTILKKIWGLIVAEASHKQFFGTDDERFLAWKTILTKLEKHNCSEAAELELNPILQNLLTNSQSSVFIKLNLLCSHGLMRKLKNEKNQIAREEIFNFLAAKCKTLFLKEIYSIENDERYTIQLDIANAMFSDSNFKNFNLGMWLFLSHLEQIVPTDGQKNITLPPSKTNIYFHIFLLMVENFSKIFPTPTDIDYNGLLAISKKMLEIKTDSTDLGLIVQKLTSIRNIDVLKQANCWADLALSCLLKCAARIYPNGPFVSEYYPPRTIPSNKALFGESVMELVLELLKRSQESTNPEDKAFFLNKALLLFTSTELPKYFSKEQINNWASVMDHLLSIVEIYCDSERDLCLIDSKYNFSERHLFLIDSKFNFIDKIFELPLSIFIHDQQRYLKYIHRLSHRFGSFICALNEPKNDKIYENLIEASSKILKIPKEYLKNPRLQKNFYETLLLADFDFLEQINKNPTTIGSGILLNITIDDFSEISEYKYLSSKESDLLMDKITLTIIRNNFLTKSWVFTIIGSVPLKNLSENTEFTQQFLQTLKCSIKTHENLILLNPAHLLLWNEDIKLKQKTITSLLLKLLDQPPTGPLIISLCSIVDNALKGDYFPTTEMAFGESTDKAMLHQKLLNLIKEAKKLGYTFYNNEFPLLRLKQLIMRPHPIDLSAMYVFGINHPTDDKNKTAELILSLVDAFIEVGTSKSIPEYDGRRLKFLTLGLSTLVYSLGLGLLDDHIPEYQKYSDIIYSQNIFEFPVTHDHFEEYIITMCASLLTSVPDEYSHAHTLIKDINVIRLRQLSDMPSSFLEYASNNSIKQITALKLCQLIVNGFLNCTQPISTDFNSNITNIKVMSNAQSCIYFILKNNFKLNIFADDYKNYLILCNSTATQCLELLDRERQLRTNFVGPINILPQNLIHAKLLVGQITDLYLKTPANIDPVDQLLRISYLKDFLNQLNNNGYNDLYKLLTYEMKEIFSQTTSNNNNDNK